MIIHIQRDSRPALLKAIQENEAKGFTCRGRYKTVTKFDKSFSNYGKTYQGCSVRNSYIMEMWRDEE